MTHPAAPPEHFHYSRARLISGRPLRSIRRNWSESKLSALRIAVWVAYAVAILLVVLLYWLITGRVDGWSPAFQALFVLGLLLVGGYLAAVTWLALRGRYPGTYYGVLGVVATTVVAGAALGFRGCVGDRVPFFTHIYYGLLLLTGEQPGNWGTDACPNEPVIVQVAQFAGVGVLFAAVLRVIVELTSHKFAVERAHWSPKVTLVSGVNEDSIPVIRSLVDDRGSGVVVVVEPDPEHPLLSQVRKAGAKVITGEVSRRDRDQKWLTRVATFRRSLSLEQVYLLRDDDSANVADADVIRDVLAELGPLYRRTYLPPTRVIVRIDRYRQARHYVAEQVTDWGTADAPRIFLASLGTTQATAQALVQRIVERGRPSLTLVVGESDLADAFIDEWTFQKASAQYLAECLGQNPDPAATARRRFLDEKAASSDPVARPTLPSLSELQMLCATQRRTTVVLAGDPDDYDIHDLEELAQQLDGSKIRLFVPRRGTKGIAEYTLLGSLHFYGLSLGGLDKKGQRREWDLAADEAGLYADSPLFGVPEDSWLRAAKLISDSYGIERGPNTWADTDPTNKLSNFRGLWHTLSYLSGTHDWVARRPAGYVRPSDETLASFAPLEHTNWYEFKRHLGWVGCMPDETAKGKARSDCLENEMVFPWDQLSTDARLSTSFTEAGRRTTDSIKNNVRALEALGYYAVPKAELVKLFV